MKLPTIPLLRSSSDLAETFVGSSGSLPNNARPATVPLNLVALSGNVRIPSRTAALVRVLAEAIGNNIQVSQIFLSMSDVAPSIMGALTREALTSRGLAYIRLVEAADILVVGSPIYRASYTGALKHFFDLVDYRALTGAVGVIAATGGSALYALATEHQFRPLLGFFGVTAVPTTIFALETDFEAMELSSNTVRNRIDKAAAEVASFAPLAAHRHAALLRAV